MDDWRDYAACRHEDPDLFYPIGTSGPTVLQTEQAKAVCRRCSVREQCLRWALDQKQFIGIWGGTSEDERRALRQRAG
ncbi:WhiB family transcriptional regulator [Streptomyces sp. CA-251387]|uniref:WhiB family transcriptional regulator n=1 Tax=Streptomyces sp. CA-251387 TaxID=3240064 RepID=UPI003D8AE949